MFLRAILALIIVVAIWLALPPLVVLSGLAIPAAAVTIFRILVIGAALIYVITGKHFSSGL